MFNNMHFNTKQLLSIMIIVLISVFVLSSCDKAKEAIDDTTEAVGNAADKAGEVAGDAVDKVSDVAKDVAEKADEVVNDAVDNTGEAVDKVADVINSNKMVGVWTGKLDIRTATLEITKQNGLEFEGKIVVNFKNTINQEIKGSLNAETMEVKMIDQLRSKRKGIYEGKLDEKGSVISGIFKTNDGDKKYNFKLTKK